MNYDELVKELRHYSLLTIEPLHSELAKAADAVEELQQTVKHYKGCADDWDKEACDYKAALPRWISVKERLPETREYYLTFTTECETYICDFIPSVKQWCTEPGDDWIMNVTHWMPLPQPPKEDINHVG